MTVAIIEPNKMLKIKEKEDKKPLFLQSIGEEYVNPIVNSTPDLHNNSQNVKS